MNFILLLLPSLLSALLAYLVRPYRVAVGWANAGLSLVSLGAALAFAAAILAGVKRRPSARVSCCALIASLRC